MPPSFTGTNLTAIIGHAMPIRICAIDVGTHSTRFLTCDVVDGERWRAVDRGLKVTALGRGLSQEGRIFPGAAAISAKAIRSFAQRARDAGAVHIRANGTMALRSAANSGDIIALMEEEAGIPIHIISGLEEAELTYSGVTRALRIESENAAVIDIGGGSTEIVWKPGEKGPDIISCETGCLTLTDRFLVSDPPAPSEIKRMENSIYRTLAAALPHRELLPSSLAGAGGTITTAAAIELGMKKYDGSRIHGMRISREQVKNSYERLVRMKLTERETVPGLMKERAPVIAAGLAIVSGIMDRLDSEALTVSDYGILLGAIMKIFEEEIKK
ncbi:MAG: hypothetical protein P9M00_08020 [Candidatus Tritonobacter lacicola]|nr:hypothetical protein [Candidatus Tritonobacter lacicola]